MPASPPPGGRWRVISGRPLAGNYGFPRGSPAVLPGSRDAESAGRDGTSGETMTSRALSQQKSDLPPSPESRGRATSWIRGWCCRIGRTARSMAPRPTPATLRRWTPPQRPRRRGRQFSIKSNRASERGGPRSPSDLLPATWFCTTPPARSRSR